MYVKDTQNTEHSRGASSALPVADEAEQPVPADVRAFPTQEIHLFMVLNLSQCP